MLQRNDTGYAQTITTAAPAPALPVSVDVQPGQVADLPDLMFGWTTVDTGAPVVTVPEDLGDVSLPWRESAFAVEPTDPAPPPAKGKKTTDTTEPEGAVK